ncbi:uncharacterized protein A4U43_C08F2890 [Asparagus officinalis]|nr:uncharacterized protein A4U43_C08F2890 [Asparagus officinalis]
MKKRGRWSPKERDQKRGKKGTPPLPPKPAKAQQKTRDHLPASSSLFKRPQPSQLLSSRSAAADLRMSPRSLNHSPPPPRRASSALGSPDTLAAAGSNFHGASELDRMLEPPQARGDLRPRSCPPIGRRLVQVFGLTRFLATRNRPLSPSQPRTAMPTPGPELSRGPQVIVATSSVKLARVGCPGAEQPFEAGIGYVALCE